MLRFLLPAIPCLLLLAPPPARALLQARLVPEVTAGGGWADDLFPGAGFGPHGQMLFAPGLGADLSTGPVVKLLSRYRYTLSRYLRAGEDAGSQGHDAELTTRVRLGRGFDLDVPVSAGFLALDETTPVEEGLPALAAMRWLDTGPLLRYRIDPASRVEGGTSLRLTGFQIDHDLDADRWKAEPAWVVFAGASRRLGARVEAALRYDHAEVSSDLPGHDRGSDGLVAAVAAAPWGELVARASAGAEHVRYPSFEAGLREDVRRQLAVSLFHPVGDHVDVETSVSWTTTTSNRFEPRERLSTWLGLRADLPYWL